MMCGLLWRRTLGSGVQYVPNVTVRPAGAPLRYCTMSARMQTSCDIDSMVSVAYAGLDITGRPAQTQSQQVR